MMKIGNNIPVMPSVEEAASFLHAKIHRYPNWKTNRQISDKPWFQNRRTDYLDQLERRNPHWLYVYESQRAAIVGQITQTANILVENQQACSDLFGLDNATHLYLRHGITWRPLTPNSDIDMVVITKNITIDYTEKRITWKGINQFSRIWHIGYIGLDSILEGQSQGDVMHVKIDLYRGVCLFGEDIFEPADQPPPLAWLVFANQFMGYGLKYLSYPEGFWAQKAALRFQEAIHILKNLYPSLNTSEFEDLIELTSFIPPREFYNLGIELLWECYHRLAEAFPKEY